MWSGMNRRKFPRASYKCLITLIRKDEKASIYSTYTDNIGMGGISTQLKNEIDLFKSVRLELSLDDGGGTIMCEGVIVWVVKKTDAKKSVIYDTGVEFIDIKEADRERIGKIVEKLVALP